MDIPRIVVLVPVAAGQEMNSSWSKGVIWRSCPRELRPRALAGYRDFSTAVENPRIKEELASWFKRETKDPEAWSLAIDESDRMKP